MILPFTFAHVQSLTQYANSNPIYKPTHATKLNEQIYKKLLSIPAAVTRNLFYIPLMGDIIRRITLVISQLASY